jgi:hypothetical protein
MESNNNQINTYIVFNISLKMPLQNRVDPLGQIFSSSCRGTWTGNRGVIHKNKKIVSPFKTRYWITCALKYKDFQRTVMTENRWTELFFLDEATAFSAGHRPCGFCRHPAYKLFKKYWLAANGDRYELHDDSIKSIDNIIHQDRLLPNGDKRTYNTILRDLPDGVMIRFSENVEAFLYYNGYLLLWKPFGYQEITLADPTQNVDVLTPSTMVEVLRMGYEVDVHESTNSLLSKIGT